jgi:hypothetical protein
MKDIFKAHEEAEAQMFLYQCSNFLLLLQNGGGGSHNFVGNPLGKLAV